MPVISRRVKGGARTFAAELSPTKVTGVQLCFGNSGYL